MQSFAFNVKKMSSNKGFILCLNCCLGYYNTNLIYNAYLLYLAVKWVIDSRCGK